MIKQNAKFYRILALLVHNNHEVRVKISEGRRVLPSSTFIITSQILWSICARERVSERDRAAWSLSFRLLCVTRRRAWSRWRWRRTDGRRGNSSSQQYYIYISAYVRRRISTKRFFFSFFLHDIVNNRWLIIHDLRGGGGDGGGCADSLYTRTWVFLYFFLIPRISCTRHQRTRYCSEERVYTYNTQYDRAPAALSNT